MEMLSLPRARWVSMTSLNVFSGISRSSRAVCRLSGSCTAVHTSSVLQSMQCMCGAVWTALMVSVCLWMASIANCTLRASQQSSRALCLTSRSRPVGLWLLRVKTSLRLLIQASSPLDVSSIRMDSQHRKKLGSSTNRMSRSDISLSACCTCNFALPDRAVGVPDGPPDML